MWQQLLLDDAKPVWRNVRTNELTSIRPDPAHILNEHRQLLHAVLTDSMEEARFRAFSRLHHIEDSLDFLLAVTNYRNMISALSRYPLNFSLSWPHSSSSC